MMSRGGSGALWVTTRCLLFIPHDVLSLQEVEVHVRHNTGCLEDVGTFPTCWW